MIIAALRRLLPLFLLPALLLPAAALAGPQVLIVTSRAEGAYAETESALKARLKDVAPRAEVGTATADEVTAAMLGDSRAIVTIGSQAARIVALAAPRQAVVHTLLPAATYEQLPPPAKDGAGVTAVLLDQPAERQIALIRLALPEWKRIALISGPGSAAQVRELATIGRRLGLEARSATVGTDRELYPALQRVLAEQAVLIATADAHVFNSFTVQNVLLTAYHHRSPVLGFSAAYVRAGALLGLYSTPEQIATHAAGIVARALQGAPLPAPSAPAGFEVAVNANVARSLGISLDAGERLAAELARQETARP